MLIIRSIVLSFKVLQYKTLNILHQTSLETRDNSTFGVEYSTWIFDWYPKGIIKYCSKSFYYKVRTRVNFLLHYNRKIHIHDTCTSWRTIYYEVLHHSTKAKFIYYIDLDIQIEIIIYVEHFIKWYYSLYAEKNIKNNVILSYKFYKRAISSSAHHFHRSSISWKTFNLKLCLV